MSRILLWGPCSWIVVSGCASRGLVSRAMAILVSRKDLAKIRRSDLGAEFARDFMRLMAGEDREPEPPQRGHSGLSIPASSRSFSARVGRWSMSARISSNERAELFTRIGHEWTLDLLSVSRKKKHSWMGFLITDFALFSKYSLGLLLLWFCTGRWICVACSAPRFSYLASVVAFGVFPVCIELDGLRLRRRAHGCLVCRLRVAGGQFAFCSGLH